MEDEVVELLVSFLGEYTTTCSGWYSFDCPNCALENGCVPDGKHNLEVFIDLSAKGYGGFHCWKCADSDGTRGTLSALFKKYAPYDKCEEFMQLADGYRRSRSYSFTDDENPDEGTDDVEMILPYGVKPIELSDTPSNLPYKYLLSRGINDRIIKKYNIGYISMYDKDFRSRGKVYIPSYDIFGNLTYWVGRDYTGNDKFKVKNPKKSKTKVVFNDGLVNWYEPIVLVEGPFDHIATPNSIPLLGKTLKEDYAVYDALVKHSRSDIIIFLDDDAKKDAYKIYKLLDKGPLNGRVKMVDTPEGYDPSLIYEKFGWRGIMENLCSARQLCEFELTSVV